MFAVESVGGQSGLLEGNVSFFLKETAAVIISAAYAFVFTYLMLMIINLITKVKVSEADEDLGLDRSIHGESAYDEGAL